MEDEWTALQEVPAEERRLDADPEKGQAAEIASALDASDDAQTLADKLEKAATEAVLLVEQIEAARRAAKARAKAGIMAQEVTSLGGPTVVPKEDVVSDNGNSGDSGDS